MNVDTHVVGSKIISDQRGGLYQLATVPGSNLRANKNYFLCNVLKRASSIKGLQLRLKKKKNTAFKNLCVAVTLPLSTRYTKKMVVEHWLTPD